MTRDLMAAVERLRTVREAQKRFLAMWAMECLLDQKAAWARIQQDLATAGDEVCLGDPVLSCRGIDPDD